MKTQTEAVNERVFPAGVSSAQKPKAADSPKKSAEASAGHSYVPPNVNDDKVSISENGSIDLTMFNYIDKGGNAGEALAGGEGERKAFAPKPNFIGMSVTRYGQMKAEIEQNYSGDPDTKNKYLQELDKALDDYVMLQAKIADQMAKKAAEGGNGEDKAAVENEKIDMAELKRLYQVGSKEIKAILTKLLGDAENGFTNEVDKAINGVFADVYKQKMGTSSKNGLGEGKRDPRVTKAWDSIKLHIDSE